MQKIDYDKTKLVAFGDSFTFGQGVFPIPDNNKTQLSWKAESNSVSYPTLLADNLNFNSVENYAAPGCSNPGMMSIMRSYYNSNPTNKDVLYLVGLTTPDRDWIMRYMDHKEKYDPVDFTYNHWLQGHNHNNKNARKPGGFDSPLYYDISQRSMEEFLTHYWNNYTILLKHAEFYFSLIDFFEARGLNYILVDVVNDALAKIDRHNVLEKVSTSGWNNIFKEAYGFDLVVNSYYEESKKNKNYVNWFTLRDITYYIGTKQQNLKTPAFQNLNHYVLQYGVDANGQMKSMLSTLPDDQHWNEKGHVLVSKLLSEFITKNYGENNE